MMRRAPNAHEVILRWTAGRWHARGEGFALAHVELAALDAAIVRMLRERHGACRAHVRFDLDTLPRWLLQYHAHYCNYTLAVEGPP